MSGPRAGLESKRLHGRWIKIESAIREEIPKDQLKGIIDNIGLPYSGINLTYSNSGVASAADADILVSLAEKHDPTAQFVSKIRKRMHRDFPGITSSFPPADIVAQILNFGLPAPIDRPDYRRKYRR